jgi:SPP1 family predicted phage head-tail adaptor
MNPLSAGELWHRISITKTVEVDDGHGGWEETTVTVAAQVPAQVEPLAGRDLQYAQQIEPRATYRIRLRFRPDLTSAQTVTYHDNRRGDRRFEIVAPPLDLGERHWDHELLCREAEALP